MHNRCSVRVHDISDVLQHQLVQTSDELILVLVSVNLTLRDPREVVLTVHHVGVHELHSVNEGEFGIRFGCHRIETTNLYLILSLVTFRFRREYIGLVVVGRFTFVFHTRVIRVTGGLAK